MSNRVIQNVIKREVLESSSPEIDATHHHSDQELRRYLTNPHTRDLVYMTMIDRMNDCIEDNKEEILDLCIRLLKVYIPKYTPTSEVIEELDRYLQNLFHSLESEKSIDLKKSIQFGRALLNSHSIRNKQFILNRLSLKSGQSTVNLTRKYGTITTLRKNELKEEQHSKLGNCKKVLVYNPYFGREFCRLKEIGFSKYEPIHWDDCFVVNDSQSEDRIRTVCLAKKKEEVKMFESYSGPRRKPVQLFQFKYYNQQEPLHLLDHQMETVVDAVINSVDYSTLLIASKILIKVLVDKVTTEGDGASRLIISILLKLLESENPQQQHHAFNLLFNLSIHINLWEETILIDSSVPSDKTKNTLDHIESIQWSLFGVLKELLHTLYQRHQSGHFIDTKVWSIALNCLLLWITCDGKVIYERLEKLDIFLFPLFLKYTRGSGIDLQKHLLQMLVHLLYRRTVGSSSNLTLRSSSPSSQSSNNSSTTSSHTRSIEVAEVLDFSLLKQIGGIQFIITYFISTQSIEAKYDLFLVIYDYITRKKRKRRLTDDWNLELLKKIEAPILFSDLFVLASDSFVNSIISYIWSPNLSCSPNHLHHHQHSHYQLNTLPTHYPQYNNSLLLSTNTPTIHSSSMASVSANSSNNGSLTPNIHQSANIPSSKSTNYLNSKSTKSSRSLVSLRNDFDMKDFPTVKRKKSKSKTKYDKSDKSHQSHPEISVPDRDDDEDLSIDSTTSTSTDDANFISTSNSSLSDPRLGDELDPPDHTNSNNNNNNNASNASLDDLNQSNPTLSQSSDTITDHLDRFPLSNVDKRVFVKILNGFHTLATEYLMPNEIKQTYENILNSSTANDNSSLISLFKKEIDQQSIELICLNILKSKIQQILVNPIEFSIHLEYIIGVFKYLTSTPNYYPIFLNVLLPLVSYIACQMNLLTLGVIDNILTNLLNDLFMIILPLIQNDEEKLLSAFHIIWTFHTLTCYVPKQKNENNKSTFKKFLLGGAVIPRFLLLKLNISIFHQLFLRITNKNYWEIRQILLAIIIEKCKNPNNLEIIGGIPFFRNLLVSVDPVIAIYASRFLIEQLEKEKPEEYQIIMSRLLTIAQQTNDDQLLSNPYLQIKTIIGGL